MPIAIPPGLLENIKEYCKLNSLGMGSAWGDTFGVIIIGSREAPPDLVALAAANSLIEGVITNQWNIADEASKKEREVQIINEPPDPSVIN